MSIVNKESFLDPNYLKTRKKISSLETAILEKNWLKLNSLLKNKANFQNLNQKEKDIFGKETYKKFLKSNPKVSEMDTFLKELRIIGVSNDALSEAYEEWNKSHSKVC